MDKTKVEFEGCGDVINCACAMLGYGMVNRSNIISRLMNEFVPEIYLNNVFNEEVKVTHSPFFYVYRSIILAPHLFSFIRRSYFVDSQVGVLFMPFYHDI